jgi:hypothetical protein
MRYRLAICNLGAPSGREWKLCCRTGNVKCCVPECVSVTIFLKSAGRVARNSRFRRRGRGTLAVPPIPSSQRQSYRTPSTRRRRIGSTRSAKHRYGVSDWFIRCDSLERCLNMCLRRHLLDSADTRIRKSLHRRGVTLGLDADLRACTAHVLELLQVDRAVA